MDAQAKLIELATLVLAIPNGIDPRIRQIARDAMPAPEPSNVVHISNETLAIKPDTETHVRLIVDQGDRSTVIKAIKDALQKRSGKAWSVTGGKGTAYGWLEISAPPSRRTWTHEPKPGLGDCPPPGRENWELVDCGRPGCCMSPTDSKELAQLLGLDREEDNYISVPAGSDYRREYLHRALYGNPGSFKGEVYWD